MSHWITRTASRLIGRPLLIDPIKLDVILSVISPRLFAGASGAESPDDLAHLAQPRVAKELLLAPTIDKASLSERPLSSTDNRAQQVSPTANIAVIPIQGSLVNRTLGLEAESGLTSYSSLEKVLSQAVNDPHIEGIILDMDSPGGEAGGVFDLSDRLFELNQIKPIWAVVNDSCFSAAYALAASAGRVFVTRTAGVGSIGVIAVHVDQSVRDSQMGLHYSTIYAGAHKNDLNPHAPLSPQAQKQLQEEVNRLYALFTQTVADRRGLSVDDVQQTQAACYFGQQAVDVGLADEIGTLNDAVHALNQHIQEQRQVSGAFSTEDGMSKVFSASALTDAVCLSSQTSSIKDPSMPQHTDHYTQNAESLTPSDAQSLSLPMSPPVTTTKSSTKPSTMTVDEALEISQLCALAGRPEMTASFISLRTPTQQVRAHLLELDAHGSPEIRNQLNVFNGSDEAPSTPSTNVLMQAVKQMISKP